MTKARNDVVERARAIIRSGRIEDGQQATILEAAIALRRNGGELALEDQRIVDSCIAMYGRDFDAAPPPPSPFDRKIDELRAEIGTHLVRYEGAREQTWEASLELGGSLNLADGRIIIATGAARRKLSADEERRLTQIAEACAANELLEHEEVEQTCAVLREQIHLLTNAARVWRDEQAGE